MTEQFKPGDLVECVDASPGRITKKAPPLRTGEIYTVQEVLICSIAGPGLRLDKGTDCPWWARGDAYRPDRFRLIHRPDSRFADANEHIRHPVSA